MPEDCGLILTKAPKVQRETSHAYALRMGVRYVSGATSYVGFHTQASKQVLCLPSPATALIVTTWSVKPSENAPGYERFSNAVISIDTVMCHSTDAYTTFQRRNFLEEDSVGPLARPWVQTMGTVIIHT